MAESQNQGKNSGLPAGQVLDTCQRMIDCMRLDLTVTGSEEEGVLRINLTGADRPCLLSNSASLLNCLEYLLRRIYRGTREEAAGVFLDSDGYWRHREAELNLLAAMASEKVLAMKKPLGLQPMTPRERRIIHLALAGIEGVETRSSGDGDNRSITIYPS